MEQHVPFGDIGMIQFDQLLDHLHHLRNVFGRPRFRIGRQGVERTHIFLEGLIRAFRQLTDGDAFGLGGVDDLVVYVGDVADIGDAREEPLQEPKQHVEDDHRPGVADMGKVVDRRTADIDPHVIGL